MSMRIAIDARHIRDFGVGTYIRNLVHALAAMDADSSYLLILPPSEADPFGPLPPNFRIVPYAHSDIESMDHVSFPLFLKRLPADLYHIPLNRVPLAMIRPYVVTIHDMSRQVFAESSLRNQLSLFRARRTLLRASSVIAVSDATRRDAEAVLGIPAGRVRRIYNALDPRFLSRDLSPENQGQYRDWEHFRRVTMERYQIDYPYVLYAGNIRPQKNIPRLIEAFAVLRGELASHPRYDSLRLVVIGDEISKYPDVRQTANKTRAGNTIRFLGYVPFDTLRAFYESAAAFAFPSLHEGFGLPPLEAMACGAPVVTSNLSSLPEVVGDAALQVNPEKVFELARALKQVLLDEPLRASLIERGYRQAARFSWEDTARQVLDTYREASAR